MHGSRAPAFELFSEGLTPERTHNPTECGPRAGCRLRAGELAETAEEWNAPDLRGFGSGRNELDIVRYNRDRTTLISRPLGVRVADQSAGRAKHALSRIYLYFCNFLRPTIDENCLAVVAWFWRLAPKKREQKAMILGRNREVFNLDFER